MAISAQDLQSLFCSAHLLLLGEVRTVSSQLSVHSAGLSYLTSSYTCADSVLRTYLCLQRQSMAFREFVTLTSTYMRCLMETECLLMMQRTHSARPSHLMIRLHKVMSGSTQCLTQPAASSPVDSLTKLERCDSQLQLPSPMCSSECSSECRADYSVTRCASQVMLTSYSVGS